MDIELIKEYAGRGLSRPQVARLMGIPYFKMASVQYIEFEPGKSRNQYTRHSPPLSDIIDIKNKGFNVEEIAIILDVKKEYIQVMIDYKPPEVENPELLTFGVKKKTRNLISGSWK